MWSGLFFPHPETVIRRLAGAIISSYLGSLFFNLFFKFLFGGHPTPFLLTLLLSFILFIFVVDFYLSLFMLVCIHIHMHIDHMFVGTRVSKGLCVCACERRAELDISIFLACHFDLLRQGL